MMYSMHIIEAIQDGDLEGVKKFYREKQLEWDFSVLLEHAYKYGQLAIFQFLALTCPDFSIKKIDAWSRVFVVNNRLYQKGQVDILNWLWEDPCQHNDLKEFYEKVNISKVVEQPSLIFFQHFLAHANVSRDVIDDMFDMLLSMSTKHKYIEKKLGFLMWCLYSRDPIHFVCVKENYREKCETRNCMLLYYEAMSLCDDLSMRSDSGCYAEFDLM